MHLEEYAALAMSLRKPAADDMYARENLVGEVGEYFGRRAKARRDGPPENYKVLIKKELGDILWQWVACVEDEGFTVEEVAQGNLDKLFDRKARGVLSGNGDER